MASVVGVTMVKDEADIIGRTITYMMGQVDHIIAVDNGSTDGTREILEELPVELRDDPDPSHYQARKITALARSSSGDYILPFDADEVWYTTSRERIHTAISKYHKRDVWIFTAELIEHVPTNNGVGHPFDRMKWRKGYANPLLKVAARRRNDMVFIEGAHSVNYNGNYPRTLQGQLEIRHFPYRSPEQFISKVRNGYNGRMLTDLPEDVSPHLRYFGRMLNDRGEGALEDYFWKEIYRDEGDPELVKDPCPA